MAKVRQSHTGDTVHDMPPPFLLVTVLLVGIVSGILIGETTWRFSRPPPRTKNDVNREIADKIRELRGRGIEANSDRADLVITLMNFIDIHRGDDMGVFAVRQLIMLIADGSLGTQEDERLLRGIPIATIRNALDDGDTLRYVFQQFRDNRPNANFIVAQLMGLPAE